MLPLEAGDICCCCEAIEEEGELCLLSSDDSICFDVCEVFTVVWVAGVLNLRYCAIILLQLLHLYSPFSIRITSSPSSSFGFS
jgi:hypothetical protein